MSFEQATWVWKNGELIPWKDATVHVSAHALHYGSGVFEGIRCYDTAEGPAVFRLDAHLDRLYDSASVYGMEIPYNRAQLAEAVCEVIRGNGFRSCYVRPICFFGSASLALNPQRCPVEAVIFAWPWETYLGNKALEAGVRVTLSPWVKLHSRMLPTTAKACGQYVNSILAVREAMGRGYDEALLLASDRFDCRRIGRKHLPGLRGKASDQRRTALDLAGGHARCDNRNRLQSGPPCWNQSNPSERSALRRRSVLHGHSRRSDAHPRGGRPADRKRRARAADRQDPAGILRGHLGARPPV